MKIKIIMKKMLIANSRIIIKWLTKGFKRKHNRNNSTKINWLKGIIRIEKITMIKIYM